MVSANKPVRVNGSKGYDVKLTQRLWKYMDFPRFLNMLSNNKLILKRLDKFEDKFEGRVPMLILDKMPFENRQRAREIYEERRKKRFVDCWTRFDGKESYAMWKIYSANYGVAIETEVEAIKSLFPSNAIISRVKYLDFRTVLEEHITDLPLLWDSSIGEDYSELAKNFSAVKSIEYEYEKEVRVILPSESKEECTSIDVDMKKLIKRVVISPYEEQWFYDLVEDIVKNRYKIEGIPIVRPDIDTSYT